MGGARISGCHAGVGWWDCNLTVDNSVCACSGALMYDTHDFARLVALAESTQDAVAKIAGRISVEPLTVGGGQTRVASDQTNFRQALIARYGKKDLFGEAGPVEAHHILRQSCCSKVDLQQFDLECADDPKNGLLLSHRNHGLFETGYVTLLHVDGNRFTAFAFHQSTDHLHGKSVRLAAEPSLLVIAQHNKDCYIESKTKNWDPRYRQEFEQLVALSDDESSAGLAFEQKIRRHRVTEWLLSCAECNTDAAVQCMDCKRTSYCSPCFHSVHADAKRSFHTNLVQQPVLRPLVHFPQQTAMRPPHARLFMPQYGQAELRRFQVQNLRR